MKKFLIILCCVALLLQAAALSAFADDSYSFSVHNSVNPLITLTVNGSSVSDISSGSSYSSSVSDSVVALTVFMTNSPSSFGRLYFDSGLTYEVSRNSSSPSVLEYGSTIYVGGSFSSSELTYYIYTESPPPPEPFEDLGVNDGVDSSISYTGQVLHFLSTNTTTVVLIGLSVAMCAVLPFAIRKIKQIIKGY